MICLINHHSRLLVLTLFLIIFPPALLAGERDDLYSEGMAAYSSKQHVEALKKLYAFYVLNEAEINQMPEFKRKLEEKIATSEAVLKLSFASNPSVQVGSKAVRIITKKKGGSFIGTGKEVEDLMSSKAIDLKAIQEINHKALTMSSSGYSR